MLAVASAPLTPQALEALAALGVEEVVRVVRETQKLAARRLKLVHARRLGRGEVSAHAVARRDRLDKPAEVFERARVLSELLGRVAEDRSDERERIFERGLPRGLRLKRRGRAPEALAQLGLGLPHTRRQARVGQRVELLRQAEQTPLLQPEAEGGAHLRTHVPRVRRPERRPCRQQSRPFECLLRERLDLGRGLLRRLRRTLRLGLRLDLGGGRRGTLFDGRLGTRRRGGRRRGRGGLSFRGLLDRWLDRGSRHDLRG